MSFIAWAFACSIAAPACSDPLRELGINVQRRLPVHLHRRAREHRPAPAGSRQAEVDDLQLGVEEVVDGGFIVIPSDLG